MRYRSTEELDLKIKKCKLRLLEIEIEERKKEIAFRKMKEKMLADLLKKEGRA